MVSRIASVLQGVVHPPKTRRRRRIVVAFLMVLCCALRPLMAQDQLLPVFHLERISSASVSSHAMVDKDGYVWFSGLNGLRKYDGFDFETYLPNPDNPGSISSHNVVSLCQDRKQRSGLARGMQD